MRRPDLNELRKAKKLRELLESDGEPMPPPDSGPPDSGPQPRKGPWAHLPPEPHPDLCEREGGAHGGARLPFPMAALPGPVAELAAAKRARALRAERLTLRAIGARLVAEGHRPRRAAAWSPVVVRRLIEGKREPSRPKPSDRLAAARARLLASTDEAAKCPAA